jgi:hypothetical protein
MGDNETSCAVYILKVTFLRQSASVTGHVGVNYYKYLPVINLPFYFVSPKIEKACPKARSK